MIVVDASVAAKWVIPGAHSETALALVADANDAGEIMVAPPLLPFEFANILRQHMVRRGLVLAEANRLMTQFLAFPVVLTMPAGLSQRALALADIIGLRAA